MEEICCVARLTMFCFFCQQNPAVKLRLMCRYCSDHYGSVVWDMNNSSVEDVCTAWRKGLRRSYDLPRCSHSLFVPAICELLPLKYELLQRSLWCIDWCHCLCCLFFTNK